jgi:hypothetical protein
MNDELRSILCREELWNIDHEHYWIRFRDDNTGDAYIPLSHIHGNEC